MAVKANEMLIGEDEATSPSASLADAVSAESNNKYTVVARRYRPKTFEELVGQDTVAIALMRAIETHRVGHAYLFTGARGVGKTSTARIFAKALNASTEANGKFDPHSDVALAIDSGEDMDVIEIDGASNRGIDEIRQLRANASIRPTRSRYKIYIIDEVHMLTTQAFNALLKTLEEPPAHVKFIFCTTDPEKIPITVLSRCQRFDFPPVHSDQILARLNYICKTEGAEADEAALRLIARRAAGSMRESQSLLGQWLSFGGNRITVDEVHAMLGTADEARLASFSTRLIERDAAGAISELDSAISAGVDPGQLAEQLLGYLRDMMAVSVGGSADLCRTANPNSFEQLREWGKAWGTMTLLSALQLLDETIVRMKHSVQSRILLEVALVQICSLQNLQALADVVKAFSQQQAPPPNVRVQAPNAVPARQAPLAPTNPTSSSDLKKKAELTHADDSAPTATTQNSYGHERAQSPNSPSQAKAVTEEFDVRSPNVSSASSRDIAQESTSNTSYASPAESPLDRSVLGEINRLIDQEASHIKEPASPSAADERDVAGGHDVANEPHAAEESAASTPSASTTLLEHLQEAASSLEGLVKQCASMAIDVVAIAANQWKVKLSNDAGFALGYFRMPENTRRLLQAIQDRVGREIQLDFELTNQPGSSTSSLVNTNRAVAASTSSTPQNQLIRQAMTDPLIKRFMDMFDGQVIRVDPPMSSVPRPAMLEGQERKNAEEKSLTASG